MKRILILVVVVGLLVALPATAMAGKPDKPGKPTTTTTTAPDYWTCQARFDNGGVGWVLGAWDNTAGVYLGSDVPSCIDILSDHRDLTHWKVEWSGSTTNGTVKGLKLVFEAQVHGTVFAETVVTSESGRWMASWTTTGIENLVFVAMPHQGDKWTGPVTFTLTPGSS